MEDPILDALISSTGYQDISCQPSGYVIRFTMRDRGRIKGLAKDNDTFYLDNKDFEDIPISFLLHSEVNPEQDQYWQYWTLRGKLHRENGPAYVHYDGIKQWAIRRFFYFGLPHRENGPAKEEYLGLIIDVDSLPNHFIEKWDQANFEWFQYGKHKEQHARWAQLEGGQCYRRKKDRLLDSPQDFSPTLQAKRANVQWTSWLYDPTKDKDGIAPERLTFIDLEEDYVRGELRKRRCEGLDGAWTYNGKLYVVDERDKATWVYRFNESVFKNLLTDLGFWSGPVYRDGETEFLFLSEFNACYGSPKLD